MLPSVNPGRRPQRVHNLEANTGPQHPLSTLHERRRRPRARLTSGWRAAPLPGGGRTLWIASKGFRLHPILLSRTSPVARVVFAKPPFAGPEQVLGYLGRYTHRVAIANSRLLGLDNGRVSFTWKDYRQDGKTKVMTLSADEFIRRFLQHTVPSGFHRIRHVGFLANCHRAAKLTLCRELLAATLPPQAPPHRRWQDRLRELTGVEIDVCPCCGGQMLTCESLPPTPPPRSPISPMWCDSS